MNPAVILLALGAAGLHAGWNLLISSSADPLTVATRALAASALVVGPLTFGAWLVLGRPGLAPLAWVVLAASAVIETAYFAFLSAAYRAGTLSEVYPIARGTGPLVAVAGGLVVLGERLSAAELAGVALLLAGIWAVRTPNIAGWLSAGSRPAAGLRSALLTGVCIGLYTMLDRAGVRIGPAWLYGGWLWVAMAALLITWTRGRPLLVARGGVAVVAGAAPTGPGRRGALEPDGWAGAVLIGLLMAAAYGMALAALSLAPAAVVSPLRESGVVLVTAWGVWRRNESEGALRRLTGAALIVAGVALIAAG